MSSWTGLAMVQTLPSPIHGNVNLFVGTQSQRYLNVNVQGEFFSSALLSKIESPVHFELI